MFTNLDYPFLDSSVTPYLFLYLWASATVKGGEFLTHMKMTYGSSNFLTRMNLVVREFEFSNWNESYKIWNLLTYHP